MKNVLSISAFTLIASLIAAPAFADPPAPCGGNQCQTTPPPAPSGFTFDICGGAAFQGVGAGTFTGSEGGVLIDKSGYGGVDLTLSAGGNLCGIDCQDGGFTFAGNAGEHVNVIAQSFGNTSGSLVSAENMGMASAMIQFGSTKTPALPSND